MQDKTVSEVIETAIQREEEAYRFYMDIHAKVDDPGAFERAQYIRTLHSWSAPPGLMPTA